MKTFEIELMGRVWVLGAAMFVLGCDNAEEPDEQTTGADATATSAGDGDDGDADGGTDDGHDDGHDDSHDGDGGDHGTGDDGQTDADAGDDAEATGDGATGDGATDDGDDSSSDDCPADTEPVQCETCGDETVSPMCKNGSWTCEPVGECPRLECDGSNDDEAPDCVDNCEDQMVIGRAECWVSGEWDCGDDGVRLDQCDEA